MREARETAGQRILMYQTDHFLKNFSERFGEGLDDSAVEEIRAIDSVRSKTEPAVELLAQRLKTNTESLNEGTLVLILKRPVWNFVC